MNLPTSNNNPGDLRNVGQKGATVGTGGFAKFNSPQEGFSALLNDLQTKIDNHPEHTLADFTNQYASPSDNNDSAGYAAKLANQLKVAPNTSIGSLKGNIGQFAEAVASNEGYQGSTPPKPKSSGLSWLDTLLGVGAGVAGFAVGAAKQYGGQALTAGGAALGEGLAGPIGAVGGATLGGGIANSLGLGDKPAQQTSGGTIPQTQTETVGGGGGGTGGAQGTGPGANVSPAAGANGTQGNNGLLVHITP